LAFDNATLCFVSTGNVAGTPTYFVNGVDVGVGQNFVPSYEEWIAFFDPIINAPWSFEEALCTWKVSA